MVNDPLLCVVICSIDLRFVPDEVDSGLRILLSSIGVIESKTGCQACTVCCDAIDKTKIRYKEIWASAAMFQRHAQSVEFQRVLCAMDMCSEEPEVVIGDFSGHTGLAYLQQLCGRLEAGEA